jgi:nitrate reductase gamma subunit
MSVLVYIITYLCILIFMTAVAKRFIAYKNNPIHVRWELYPVAHEGKKAAYGGGYLEEVNWWEKTRKKSLWGELKVMIPEIFLLKAVWEHNRPLWWVTYPFHLGLYLTATFIGLLVIGAIIKLSGYLAGTWGTVWTALFVLTRWLGPAGFFLSIIGASGLIYKRMTDPGLKVYSTPAHFFNLCLFILTMGTAVLTWRFVDPGFDMARGFMANLISFNLAGIHSALFLLQVFLAVLVLAYIPLTHMSHFFMKYFLYHDIRWGDEPNINTPKTDAKINVVLNYPVTWSASHIAGHGKETWAEVATFNPAASSENDKE